MTSFSGSDQNSRSPLGVAHNDEQPAGWCELICVIPELKVKKTFSGGKLVGKPATGEYDHKFESSSVSFHVECKSKQKKSLKYVYSVKRLPGDIVDDDCKIKWKEGKVVLQLKKVDPKSWEREIKANGIDQAEEEEQIESLE